MKQMTKEIVYEYIPKYLKGKVLDVGAGNKKYKNFIEKYCDKYMTLDIQGKVDFIADAKKMPIEDSVFDSVLSFQMFEHVDEPQKIVSEIYRILKTDGIVIATAPFIVPEHADPYDYQRYTTNGFEFLFKQNGFRIIKLEKYGGPFTVFVDSLKFAYFSPYTSSAKRLKWGHRILNKLYKLADFFDKKKQDSNIYGNVLLIAQKQHINNL